MNFINKSNDSIVLLYFFMPDIGFFQLLPKDTAAHSFHSVGDGLSVIEDG